MMVTRRVPSPTALIVPGVICLGVAMTLGVQLVRPGDDQGFWTPPALAHSLESAADRVEIEVDGAPLQELLRSQALVRAEDGTPLQREDVRVRLNDRDRATWGRSVLLSGAAGAGLVLLTLGAAMARARRRGNER